MNKKTWILYGLYAVVIALFFLYYLFPAQSLKTYIAAQAERVNPDFRLTAAKAELLFPFRIRLHDVDVDHLSNRMLEIDQLTISPRWRSLIGRKSVFSFIMNAYQGRISGTADIAGGQRLVLNAVASGVQLADIPILHRMSDNQIDGVLDGTLNYAAGNGRVETMSVALEVVNMTIALATPFFTLDRFNFDNVQADAALQNRQLRISRVTLTGDQVEGNLSGYVSIENDIRLSTLSLNGTIMPQQQFIESSGFNIPPAVLRNLKTGGGIPIRLSGPLDDLRFETR